MKPSDAPIKQPFVKRDFSPKKVLLILCPTCKKAVSACYDTAKNEVPTSTRDAILYHLSHLREQAEFAYRIAMEADVDVRNAMNAHHGARQEWCKAKQNNEGLQEI